MTTQTLFDVGLLEAMDTEVKKMPLTLNPIYQKYYRKLIDYIRRCIGKPCNYLARPYRIAGERYIVIQIEGEKSRFNLTLCIAGYLNWPDLKSSKSYRLYMDVTDSVDGHYFSEYLRQDLLANNPDLYTEPVDK